MREFVEVTMRRFEIGEKFVYPDREPCFKINNDGSEILIDYGECSESLSFKELTDNYIFLNDEIEDDEYTVLHEDEGYMECVKAFYGFDFSPFKTNFVYSKEMAPMTLIECEIEGLGVDEVFQPFHEDFVAAYEKIIKREIDVAFDLDLAIGVTVSFLTSWECVHYGGYSYDGEYDSYVEMELLEAPFDFDKVNDKFI